MHKNFPKTGMIFVQYAQKQSVEYGQIANVCVFHGLPFFTMYTFGYTKCTKTSRIWGLSLVNLHKSAAAFVHFDEWHFAQKRAFKIVNLYAICDYFLFCLFAIIVAGQKAIFERSVNNDNY